MTRHESDSSTVTGTTVPRSVNICVMPTLRARIPLATLVPELDLDVHPAGHVETHQRVDHLGVGVEDVEDALVRAHLELLARVLVDERPAHDRVLVDGGGQRNRSGHAGARPGGGLDDLRGGLIQDPVVVCLQADANLLCHELGEPVPCGLGEPYFSMLVTAPAPTVRPPSRMAKRIPSSTAMGVISSMPISTLSPGMHISWPSGRVMVPGA